MFVYFLATCLYTSFVALRLERYPSDFHFFKPLVEIVAGAAFVTWSSVHIPCSCVRTTVYYFELASARDLKRVELRCLDVTWDLGI